MPSPQELTATALTVYLAPLDTEPPEVDDQIVEEAWFLLGTQGAHNYDEDGQTVTHGQTFASFIPAGGTAPRKVSRTAARDALAFTLADLTMEQYAKVLDGLAVVTTAAGVGVAGKESAAFSRGTTPDQFALIARGTVEDTDDVAPWEWSPLYMQFEWPSVIQSGEPSPAFVKGSAAGLAVEFMPVGPPGVLRRQPGEDLILL